MGKPHRNTKIMPSANASFDKRRAAIAHSRRELEKLFSKPPGRNDNAAGKSGAGDTGNDTRDASKYSEVAE